MVSDVLSAPRFLVVIFFSARNVFKSAFSGGVLVGKLRLRLVEKFSSCISDVDFEPLNTELIVGLRFGFRKPNSLCVGHFEVIWT